MDPRPRGVQTTVSLARIMPNLASRSMKPLGVADRRPAAGGRGRRRASTADHHAVHHLEPVPQGITPLSRTPVAGAAGTRPAGARGRPAHATVRLNGQPLGTVAVDHTDWRDHAFTVLALLASGTTLEIVFDNDAAAGGEDRNLFIASVGQGNTRFQPGPLQSVYDRGAGALAFDGREVSAGRAAICPGMYASPGLKAMPRWPPTRACSASRPPGCCCRPASAPCPARSSSSPSPDCPPRIDRQAGPAGLGRLRRRGPGPLRPRSEHRRAARNTTRVLKR